MATYDPKTGRYKDASGKFVAAKNLSTSQKAWAKTKSGASATAQAAGRVARPVGGAIKDVAKDEMYGAFGAFGAKLKQRVEDQKEKTKDVKDQTQKASDTGGQDASKPMAQQVKGQAQSITAIDAKLEDIVLSQRTIQQDVNRILFMLDEFKGAGGSISGGGQQGYQWQAQEKEKEEPETKKKGILDYLADAFSDTPDKPKGKGRPRVGRPGVSRPGVPSGATPKPGLPGGALNAVRGALFNPITAGMAGAGVTAAGAIFGSAAAGDYVESLMGTKEKIKAREATPEYQQLQQTQQQAAERAQNRTVDAPERRQLIENALKKNGLTQKDVASFKDNVITLKDGRKIKIDDGQFIDNTRGLTTPGNLPTESFDTGMGEGGEQLNQAPKPTYQKYAPSGRKEGESSLEYEFRLKREKLRFQAKELQRAATESGLDTSSGEISGKEEGGILTSVSAGGKTVDLYSQLSEDDKKLVDNLRAFKAAMEGSKPLSAVTPGMQRGASDTSTSQTTASEQAMSAAEQQRQGTDVEVNAKSYDLESKGPVDFTSDKEITFDSKSGNTIIFKSPHIKFETDHLEFIYKKKSEKVSGQETPKGDTGGDKAPKGDMGGGMSPPSDTGGGATPTSPGTSAGAGGGTPPSTSSATTPKGSAGSGSTASGPAKIILDFMAASEGANYDTQFGYQNTTGSKKLSEMTIGEVKQAQSKQRGSSAIGRYQFMKATLPEAMRGCSLTDNDIFSAGTQDKLAMWLLKRRGYDRWASNQLSDKDFGRNLSMEWASIPNPYTGKSYYGQKIKYSAEALLEMLKKAKGGAGATSDATRAQQGAGQSSALGAESTGGATGPSAQPDATRAQQAAGQSSALGQQGASSGGAQPAQPDATRAQQGAGQSSALGQETATQQPAQPDATRAQRGAAQSGALGQETSRPTGGNGRLPDNMLVSIGGRHKLQKTAADAYNRMVEAAKKDGITWGITDSYRTYDAQVDVARRKGLYSQGGLAARPGTSNHGWGTALDLGEGANTRGSKQNNWLMENASRFGFNTIPREPWHWEFKGGGVERPDATAGGGGGPTSPETSGGAGGGPRAGAAGADTSGGMGGAGGAPGGMPMMPGMRGMPGMGGSPLGAVGGMLGGILGGSKGGMIGGLAGNLLGGVLSSIMAPRTTPGSEIDQRSTQRTIDRDKRDRKVGNAQTTAQPPSNSRPNTPQSTTPSGPVHPSPQLLAILDGEYGAQPGIVRPISQQHSGLGRRATPSVA